MATTKPLPAKVTNHFANIAPRVTDAHGAPRELDLPYEPASGNSTDIINEDTFAVQRVFKDSAQAASCYKRLKNDNNDRNKKNQTIQKKLNNEPPNDQKKLESMGQGWRSNRPTGFLSTMVSRIQPPFKEVIETASTLTFSKYPIESADSEHKTKVFREEITKTIRGWKGHADLLAQTTHENTTFGFCAWTWDDLRDWKPEFLRQDNVFFPIEAPQDANALPLWGRKRRYQISELLPVFENPRLSALAGWHLDNLAKAINQAVPASRSLNSDEDARRWEDWIREGGYGAAYETDAKYVEIGEVVVREPKGKVSRYVMNDKDGSEICTQLDRYDSMSEAINLFAVEVGSGSLMSSRGAGRDLYNTHIAIDRARNLVIDNVYLASVILLKKTMNAKPGIAPLTVAHPIAYISEGFEVEQHGIQANVQDFLDLDKFCSGLAEIQVGTFLPGQVTDPNSGEKETASEVNRVASIENQLRQGILMRWSIQYCFGVERMQRGICHPEHVKAASDLFTKLSAARQMEGNEAAVWARKSVVSAFEKSWLTLPEFLVPFDVPSHLDEDAIACCLNMFERNLDAADILMMAYSPAEELLPDTTQQDATSLDLVVQRYTGNANVNQGELMKMDIASKIGEETANSLILPKDQVEATQIEQTRQQIIELQSILAGQEIPISGRDDDMVHLQTMTARLGPVIQSVPAGGVPPQMVQPLVQAFKHYGGHIAQAQKKGAKAKMVAPFKKLLTQAEAHLTKGHNVPDLPESVVPASAPHPHGHKSGHAPNPVKTAQEAGAVAGDQSRAGMVQSVAAPPKPSTAA